MALLREDTTIDYVAPYTERNFFRNIRSFGAAGDFTTDDTAAFGSAILDFGATPGTLYIPGGCYRVSTLTIPKNIRLCLDNGAIFYVDNELTINGPIEPVFHAWMSGPGQLTVTSSYVTNIYETLNTLTSSLAALTAQANAIQAALDAAGVIGADVVELGTYLRAHTLDLATSKVYDITLHTDSSFIFANCPSSGTYCVVTIILTQDATGSWLATWPGNVRWENNGVVPELSTSPYAKHILSFVTVDGGTTWLGLVSANRIG